MSSCHQDIYLSGPSVSLPSVFLASGLTVPQLWQVHSGNPNPRGLHSLCLPDCYCFSAQLSITCTKEVLSHQNKAMSSTLVASPPFTFIHREAHINLQFLCACSTCALQLFILDMFQREEARIVHRNLPPFAYLYLFLCVFAKEMAIH